MTFRFQGLVPAIALLAVGVAHAQSNPPARPGAPTDTGNMAYPAPLPAGNVKITAPTTRDTGNMAYPASPGGVTEATPAARDTGNMALPAGTGGPPTAVRRARRVPMAKPAASEAAAAPATAPTASGMAAAKGLDTAPSDAPVPYVDFAPAPAMKGKSAVMHGKKPMAHKAVAKKAAPAATPAAAAPTTK